MADKDYDTILRTAAAAASAAGPLAISPIPGADTLVIAGVWSTMMIAVARKAGQGVFNGEVSKKVALSVIAGAGAYWTGSKLFTWILAKIPVVGWVTGSGINAGLNGIFTLWMGYALIDLFEGPNLKIEDMATIIKQLTDAMKPHVGSSKVKRVVGFFQRIGESFL
ncbi:hypothetical protein KSD_57100 [Ktedonobacter sp. SOSP1-85]|uniref:hypothetical protein n=1 Tax=Ktedonobacter sp. SOSP1-85 TaxID=2778367 RepID=UPI001916B1CE|nr:hypothetical protein [Ktedonobacter sp. SOSP1-85]GHO77939.1 hypothetical protein KSD_57100 [Ktedonobacter sp. SOSP1-85]